MEAIRKFVTVKDNVLKVVLPNDFNNRKVELIILPVDEPMSVQEPEADYFTRFFGTVNTGLTDEELDKKLKSLREEWNRDIS